MFVIYFSNLDLRSIKTGGSLCKNHVDKLFCWLVHLPSVLFRRSARCILSEEHLIVRSMSVCPIFPTGLGKRS